MVITHLSASQINLYLQCSLKYKFQYIDKLPKPFKAAGLAFGSVMHSALEWFHKEIMQGRETTLEALYKIFEVDWFSQKVETDIHFKDGEDEMKLMVLGKEFLTLYYNSPIEKAKGAEVAFTIPLKHPNNGERLEIPMEGIIDLIEEDETIVEFKTSAKSMDPQSLNDHLQLTAYSYAYENLFNRKPKGLKVINFVKTRTPKMVIIETKRDKKDYERLFFTAREVLKSITSQIFFPHQNFMCKDCEYDKDCKEWKGR